MSCWIAVLVRRGKAYVPVQAKTEAGIYIGYAPVFLASLEARELAGAIKQAIAAGHPRIPNPTQEEWRRVGTPILKAAKVRSWKELAQGGAYYTIRWRETETKLHISHDIDPRKWRRARVTEKVFPNDTPLITLVEAILEDVRLHPELLGEDGT